VGVYLPLSSSSPILIGGLVRWFADRRIYKRFAGKNMTADELEAEGNKSPGVLLSSGYIAGGAIAGIVIAFVAGGGLGWLARGEADTPAPLQSFTVDALDAHRLYVVEVRHPVEVPGSERAHLQQWLTKRCGWDVRAPELASAGLKLVGGRLLPGPKGPASFLMYESSSGERFTIYTAKSATEATQMRYTTLDNDSAMFWTDRGVGYVVSGGSDRERLTQVARAVYEQVEKSGS